MPTKLLDRLMFAQGGACFFCRRPLPRGDASVEHLVAVAHGGGNNDDNCVACCKELNVIFGALPLKEKIRIILNQRGEFNCPMQVGAESEPQKAPTAQPPSAKTPQDRAALVAVKLAKQSSPKPRTVKTLSNTIRHLFKPLLTEAEVAAVVAQLHENGVLAVNGTKITYAL